jgi:hypothetical protein
MRRMKKSEAIDLLGGTTSAAAKAIGISPSAVSQWPDDEDLSDAIRDRVQAALWRRQHDRRDAREEAKAV